MIQQAKPCLLQAGGAQEYSHMSDLSPHHSHFPAQPFATITDQSHSPLMQLLRGHFKYNQDALIFFRGFYSLQ